MQKVIAYGKRCTHGGTPHTQVSSLLRRLLLTTISAREKFEHLISLLEGSAADCAAGYPNTEHNYNLIIQELQNRFGDPDGIVGSHINSLLQLPAVEKRGNLKALRTLHDGALLHVRALESLNIPTDQYTVFYKPIRLKKFPFEMVAD